MANGLENVLSTLAEGGFAAVQGQTLQESRRQKTVDRRGELQNALLELERAKGERNAKKQRELEEFIKTRSAELGVSMTGDPLAGTSPGGIIAGASQSVETAATGPGVAASAATPGGPVTVTSGAPPETAADAESVLSRVAEPVSAGDEFGQPAPVPLSEQDLTQPGAKEFAQETEAAQQQIVANEVLGGADSLTATAEMALRFPEYFKTFAENAGLITQQQLDEAAAFGFQVENTPPGPQRQALFSRRIRSLQLQRRDSSDTRATMDLDPEAQNRIMRVAQIAALNPDQRFGITGGPPQQQETKVGDEIVTAEFDPVTGLSSEVGRAPRSVVQRVEQGPPGSFRTDPQKGAEEQQLRSAASGTVQAIATANDLVQLVRSNETIIGKPGAFFRITNELAQAATGIAAGLGIEFEGNVEELTDPGRYDFSGIRGTAIQNEVFRAGITALAYAAAAASGQTGKSVSNEDVQRFINQIGGSTSDPVGFEATIRSFANRLARNFSINMQASGLNLPALDQMVLDALDTFSDPSLERARQVPGFDDLAPEDQKAVSDFLRDNPNAVIPGEAVQ